MTRTPQNGCTLSLISHHPLLSVLVRNGAVVPLSVLASSEKGQISRSFLFCRVKGAAAVCTDGVVGGPAPGPNRAFAVLRPCLAVMETGPPEAQVLKA